MPSSSHEAERHRADRLTGRSEGPDDASRGTGTVRPFPRQGLDPLALARNPAAAALLETDPSGTATTWKFVPPDLPAHSVLRKALLARLRAARRVPLVVVTAPSGFGKTTLAAQWAARDRRTVVWLTLDERDDDAGVLVRSMSAAMDNLGPAPVVPARRNGRGVSRLRPRTADALASAAHLAAEPFVLIVDDAHVLRDPACGEAVVALAGGLPRGAQIVVLGRGTLSLPLARLRAEGRVAELDAGDLAMAADEAEALLRNMDVEVTKREVDELTELTEGWPAALHLTGLSLAEDRFDRRSSLLHMRQFGPLVDYLRSEFLDGLSRSHRSFVQRTSVLQTMSGPMCNAVLERTGSARTLADLAASNMPIVPLDQHGERYRYHRLLRQLLRTDLDTREPDRAHELLARAARWSEEEDRVEDALAYAREIGDADLLARLLQRHALELHRHGRDAVLVPWFEWFEERDLLERHPLVAVLGAWLQMFHGRAAGVQRWADAAERGAGSLRARERGEVDALLALLRAAGCRRGPEIMERDATMVQRNVHGDPGIRAAALLLQAVARRMRGAGEDVDPMFVEAYEEAIDRRAYPTATLALSERAIIAIEQEDWLGAGELVREATAVVQLAGLEDYVTSGLLYAVAARVAVHGGDLPLGRIQLARAHRLRAAASHAMPFLAVQLRLELANAYLAITDSAGARTMLRELELLFTLRRDLGVFRNQADDVHARVSSMRAAFVGGSSLTTAELRLLPLLATHHSFREIADRLFVSRHTVKTQAISIYRKLRVTSRSEAVDTARENGLLA